jgi:integrase
LPRIAKELGPLEVKRLTAPGYHAVGKVPGLMLQITKSGTRSWVLRASVGDKRREIGLGPYPSVSLADAHRKAQEKRDEIAAGIDPVVKRKTDRQALRQQQEEEKQLAWTFRRCAEKLIDAKRPGWRNAKHAQQWENTLATYAYPVIGDMLVRDISVRHIMQIVEPYWTSKNETINRVRNRLEQVLDWAAVQGYREQANPARWRGCLDKLLPKPSDVAPVEHHPALPAAELFGFMKRLRAKHGMSAHCLEFVVLTVCRSGAARLATWDEIDWKARVWNIPADEGRKMERPLRVPLSPPALALLKSLPRADCTNIIFPNRKGEPLSDMAMTKLMRDMGVNAVPHGFRSTFSSWVASSTHYPEEVREMALGHAIGDDTVAAYQRSDLFAKRLRLMADWAAFIDTEPIKEDDIADVVPILSSS